MPPKPRAGPTTLTVGALAVILQENLVLRESTKKSNGNTVFTSSLLNEISSEISFSNEDVKTVSNTIRHVLSMGNSEWISPQSSSYT